MCVCVCVCVCVYIACTICVIYVCTSICRCAHECYVPLHLFTLYMFRITTWIDEEETQHVVSKRGHVV